MPVENLTNRHVDYLTNKSLQFHILIANKKKFMNKKPQIKLSDLWEKVDFTKFSTWLLIFSNISVIFFAIVDKLSANQVLWIYWIQSVIIGIFNFLRIITLKEFSTKGFKSGKGIELKPTSSVKISTGLFFLFHYGFFHFIYAMFLGGFSSLEKVDSSVPITSYLLYTSLFFFVNYFIEFIRSYKNEQTEPPNLGTIMFAPYIRIIPMHLTIIAGGFIGMIGSLLFGDTDYLVIVIFVGIKTFIDLITHSIDFSSTSEQLNQNQYQE